MINTKKVIIILGLAAIGIAAYFVLNFSFGTKPLLIKQSEVALGEVNIVAENLNIPWSIAFLSDDDILVTERSGTLKRINNQKTYSIEGVVHRGEGGLLGMALHPRFSENHWIYLYFTSQENGALKNRVERYAFSDDQLSGKKVILDNIPGAANHDGGRIAFGPDNYLYITTGDAGRPNLAQDTNSLAGKILRVTDEGAIPSDNPFGNAVYSYGHRNPQGLAWDKQGQLWSTEHGPSGLLFPNCCQDELNIIEKGKNYGWPDSVGDSVKSGTVAPVIHSGKNVFAPASLAHIHNSLFFGALRGQALYEAKIQGEQKVELITHLQEEFGRIRETVVGPDNYLYLTTSNRDGRGSVNTGDDKIIRIKIQ